jgi:hypothetical protein
MSGSRSRRKLTVEESYMLSIFRMNHAGILRESSGFGHISWTHSLWGSSFRVFYRIQTESAPSLYLEFVLNRLGDFEEHVQQEIDLAISPCFYGGHRFWFICPACVGRRGVLCLPPYQKHFACRFCHDLSYRSIQAHDDRVDRLVRDPEKLWQALQTPTSGRSTVALRALMKYGKNTGVR